MVAMTIQPNLTSRHLQYLHIATLILKMIKLTKMYKHMEFVTLVLGITACTLCFINKKVLGPWLAHLNPGSCVGDVWAIGQRGYVI